MPESKATIVITAKDQAGATMNKIFMEVNASMAKTTDASKKLGDETSKSGTKAKDSATSFVDMAAKLYLVEVAAKRVAEAVQAVFEAGKLGAQVEQTKISFDNMIASVGGNVNMLEELRRASNGTVSDLQLMQAAQTALIGLNRENGQAMADAIPRILEIARAASIANPALGDTAFLFESLTTGLKRMSPRLIDNTGLQLKLGDANAAYAKSVGKTVEQLTGEEKQLALLNATLEAGDRLIQQIGGSTESLVDPYDRFTASAANAGNSLATKLSPALEDFLTASAGALDEVTKLTNSVNEMPEPVQDAITGFIEGALGLTAFKNAAVAFEEIERREANTTRAVTAATEEMTDSRREAIDEMRAESVAMEELAETNQKFLEKRTQSLNSLFLRELQINDRRIESEQRVTEKIEDTNRDLYERLTEIHRDAEDERTRVTSDAAEDRAQIEENYTKRIADANKDISELYDELAGKNPFLSNDTQTGLSNAEAMVDGLESRLRDLRSQQRHNPDDEVLQGEIANVRDQLDQANELYADAKDQAREEERKNRIQAQIREKQETLAHLQTQKQQELDSINQKEQEKLAIISANESLLTAKTTAESNRRLLTLQNEFNQIAESAKRDIGIATVESFMGLVDANSKVGQSLFELQAKNYGASDSMIKDFQKVRDSISSPTGLIAALNSVDTNNSFTRTISQVSILNNQLSITNGLVNSIGLNGNLTISSGASNGKRAAGGSVAPNGSYLVGENGPEVLNMGSSGGNITPNHALGGGGGPTIIIQAGVFNGSRADAEKLAGWIGPILDQRQERFGGAYNASGTRRIQSAGRR